MKTSDTQDTPSRFSLKALVGIVLLAIVFSVVTTLLVARIWLFPSAITPVDLSQQEQAVLDAKLNALKGPGFDKASPETGVPAPEPYVELPEDRIIYFSQRELNAMIARNPDLANRVSLHLSDKLISASMLVTMPEDFPVLGGKTIRVSTGMRVDYQQGSPVVSMEGVSIMGVPLPGAWLGGIKGKDLVSFYGSDGGFWQAFSHGVRDLRVQEGRLRVELAD